MTDPQPFPDHSGLADPMEAWKARGRELNVIYDVLRPAVHDEESQGDAVADLQHLVAERDRLRSENEALRELYTEENNERAKAQAEVANLRAGISWARGMLSDETPHALVDMFLGALLGGPPLPSDEQEAHRG